MPHGRSISPSSKRPGTYPTPSWWAAGEYIRQRAIHVFNAGPNVAWKVARNRDFWRFDKEVATLALGHANDDDDIFIKVNKTKNQFKTGFQQPKTGLLKNRY